LETNKELEVFIQTSVSENTRNNLSDRGIAWSIMRVNGVYTGRATFVPTIDTDLAEYGFSLLRAALALREIQGEADLISKGFESAGRSFESLITNSAEQDFDKGFYEIIAACSYHLAGYSAIAFSILKNHENRNNNAAEIAIKYLIIRDLKGLRQFIEAIFAEESVSDERITSELQEAELSNDDAISTIANASICRALAYFDFALQTGMESQIETAKFLLKKVVNLTSKAGFVTLWWVSRLCLNLIDDLWNHSLHKNLPTVLPSGGEELYPQLRKEFILSLYARDVSEVELWPSQMEATKRSNDITDDLVVALPTSAGKTRIAEIAALITLSIQKRVVIVTPLRALSAQTERSFRKTFAPLGYTVSSLYGASGMSPLDEDALKDKNVVIATPEKLDFALRNDPSILNDIGLIILDEGHMIGPTEREIRYEILVQRLLRRADSDKRRIVCLSAILPDGKNLNDFTKWLRSDKEGNAVKFPWRPTRQRFGTLIWRGENATLNFDHKNDIPFINKFIQHVPAIKPHSTPRPTDLNQKTLFAAWKFASQGKRTLIFITQANWVEKFGVNALELVKKGYLESLLEDRADVENALAVGQEWLGKEHPAVKALEIGIAVHHGGLPNPFLRELELLLSKGIIKVTVASPTLSQGLNINAAVLLVPYLVRSGIQISGEEFANVAGRAGRAFVDMEGFVIHVIENDIESRKADWRKLIASARERTLTSGLFQVINSIYEKLSETTDLNKQASFEYLSNNAAAWFPEEQLDAPGRDDISSAEFLVEKLDATVLGLVEALESDRDDLERMLEDALKGSLWARQVDVMAKEIKDVHTKILLARAKLIWANTTAETRKGHFAMGVGFDTGVQLDSIANELETMIDNADSAAIRGDIPVLVCALIKLCEKLLAVRPFRPKDPLPENWKTILEQWISGKNVDEIGADFMPFIEEVFAYKMIWALEAVRMRRISHGWKPNVYTGGGAASLENGVPQYMMSMLIRAGLPSRIAAIKAVKDGKGSFNDGMEMYIWLRSSSFIKLNKKSQWPTLETEEIWHRFYNDFFSGSMKKWHLERKVMHIQEQKLNGVADGYYRVELNGHTAQLVTPDFKKVLRLTLPFMEENSGVLSAKIEKGKNNIILERFGPGKFKYKSR